MERLGLQPDVQATGTTPTYDGEMAPDLLTMADVAGEIRTCIAEGDEPSALRLAFRCVEIFDRTTESDQLAMLLTPPAPTGDLRYDALLAAIAEYLCVRSGLAAPNWVNAPDRFVEPWWFVSGISALHADAIVHSPVSFKRRGVFITGGALTYA